MNEELISYVVTQLRAGFSHDVVRDALKDSGHDDALIDELLTEGQVRLNTVVPAGNTQNFQTSVSEAPGVITVFGGAFKIAVSRLDVLGIVFSLAVIGGVLPVILEITTGNSESIAVLLSGFLAGVVNAINIGVLLYIFTNNKNESYLDGLRWLSTRFLSYIWIAIIVASLKVGGFFLLIIPGIILSVYVVLSIPVLIAEDKRGMSAVLRSRELVRGRFWYTAIILSIFSAVALVVFVGIVLALVFSIGGFNSALVEISATTSLLISVLVSTFQVAVTILGIALMAHMYHIYTQLPQIGAGGKSARLKYNIIAWIGVSFVPVMLILAIVLASLSTARSLAEDTMVQITLSSFSAQAELYATEAVLGEVSYQGVCDELKSAYQSFSDRGVSVTCNDSNEAYAIETDVSDGQYYCVDSEGFADFRYTSIGSDVSCQ